MGVRMTLFFAVLGLDGVPLCSPTRSIVGLLLAPMSFLSIVFLERPVYASELCSDLSVYSHHRTTQHAPIFFFNPHTSYVATRRRISTFVSSELTHILFTRSQYSQDWRPCAFYVLLSPPVYYQPFPLPPPFAAASRDPFRNDRYI